VVRAAGDRLLGHSEMAQRAQLRNVRRNGATWMAECVS
jgi:hypothetical protein